MHTEAAGINAGRSQMSLDSLAHMHLQDTERKQRKEPKESPEELQECEMVFAAF